eukprot:TRINITY_DN21496_c0_g1_i1.p1 TRINITY_DN21496_c0_g1~~TRINITY_DN21496_c0_g1_i1.p1  ORF type:complete len:164 (+),score=32.25 TRINITY_DN21496_c0_g1_i1:135-626(+)
MDQSNQKKECTAKTRRMNVLSHLELDRAFVVAIIKIARGNKTPKLSEITINCGEQQKMGFRFSPDCDMETALPELFALATRGRKLDRANRNIKAVGLLYRMFHTAALMALRRFFIQIDARTFIFEQASKIEDPTMSTLPPRRKRLREQMTREWESDDDDEDED